jgi:hypothetical protein
MHRRHLRPRFLCFNHRPSDGDIYVSVYFYLFDFFISVSIFVDVVKGWDNLKGRIFAFYVVITGRECGIFHHWSDCLKSIAIFNGAMFKGFDSLDEASTSVSVCLFVNVKLCARIMYRLYVCVCLLVWN